VSDFNFIIIKQVTRDYLDLKDREIIRVKDEILKNLNTLKSLDVRGLNDIDSNFLIFQKKSLLENSNILHKIKEEGQAISKIYRDILDVKLIPFENLDHFEKIEPDYNSRKKYLKEMLSVYIVSEEYVKCSLVKELMDNIS